MFAEMMTVLSTFLTSFMNNTMFGFRIYVWIFYPFLIVAVWHAFANKEG